MQAEFRPPHRRCRILEQYEGALPVRLGPGESCEFRAHLVNQQVVLLHPEHIRRIHSRGYFGKGVLSRARPDHCFTDQWQQHQGISLPVVSAARYKELIQWAGAALTAQGLNEQAVSQTLADIQQPVDMEEVRRAVGARAEPGEDLREEEVEEQEEQEEPQAKRSCSSDQDYDLCWKQDVDQDQVSDSGHEPSVPGPGFVLVATQAEGGVAEVRRTPLAITEYLQLSLEEAFFLVYSLGCLSVYMHQEPLSIIQLWNTFRALRPDFVSSFAAYQHFRSKGWIPKEGGGAKYGVDLMLYRKGPPFYHGSYSVVVERVDGAFRGLGLRPFSWRSLAALSRITANVSKELMLCYIIHPADLSCPELNSPECLSRLQVQEVIVSRWVSSKERGEQEDM